MKYTLHGTHKENVCIWCLKADKLQTRFSIASYMYQLTLVKLALNSKLSNLKVRLLQIICLYKFERYMCLLNK